MKLIENSSFDYLQLEFGDLKLTLSKSGYSGPVPASSDVESAPTARKAETQGMGQEVKQPLEKPPAEAFVAREGTVPITAPMVGTFYTTPSPGAPPFIGLGDRVTQEATVGLIEVMKVFNAVTAGVDGTIAEISVQNGQFVEYGQPLFLVTPAEAIKAREPAG